MRILLILLIFCLGCTSYNTDRNWSQIEQINKQVNNESSSVNDCVSVAVEKQIRLKVIGVESNLAACIVDNNGHMVLLVDSYVLDSLDNTIWSQDQLGYDWWKHQDGEVWRNQMGRVVTAPKEIR